MSWVSVYGQVSRIVPTIFRGNLTPKLAVGLKHQTLKTVVKCSTTKAVNEFFLSPKKNNIHVLNSYKICCQ